MTIWKRSELLQLLADWKRAYVAASRGKSSREDDEQGLDEVWQSIDAGHVYYGNPGEEPIILESKRPGLNFASFVEIILRAMAASQGIPYESLAKDFSKTNV